MRKERSKIVDRAIGSVAGFEKVYKVIHQNTVLKGQSESTFHNYLRRIALISLHPHIHFLVPAAGITLSGKVKKISKRGRYLYPVKQLSKDFRSVMLKALKRELIRKGRQRRYQGVIDVPWSKEWNVYSEASFAGNEKVIKYLGQYTHRVAITNSRIHRVDKQNVSFYYKDYFPP